MRIRPIYSTLMVLVSAAIPSGATTLEREQLPSGVTPLHYDLSLVPDSAKLSFRGRVRIEVDVNTSTPTIVLNADELALDKAVLDTTEGAAAIALDAKLQRVSLNFARPVARGRHTLTIDYHGIIGVATKGFFAMDYNSPAGKRRTIA